MKDNLLIMDALNALRASSDLIDHLDTHYFDMLEDKIKNDTKFLDLFQNYHLAITDVKLALENKMNS